MSAPNPGRQSPDPERQSGSQGGESFAASGKIDDQKQTSGSGGGIGQEGGGSGGGGEDQAAGLESNPTHALEGEAKGKTSKTVE